MPLQKINREMKWVHTRQQKGRKGISDLTSPLPWLHFCNFPLPPATQSASHLLLNLTTIKEASMEERESNGVCKSLLVYFTALSPKATQVSLLVILASGHVPIANQQGWPEVSNNMLLHKKIKSNVFKKCVVNWMVQNVCGETKSYND